MDLGPAAPTPPIELPDPAAATARLDVERVDVSDQVIAQLQGACSTVSTEAATLTETSRDWWPLAMTWAADNEVTSIASVVCRPSDAEEVAAIAAICNQARIPLTAAAGRSGVMGGSIPIFGGVVLDLTGLVGIVDVDDVSGVVDVRCGTFGDHLEDELRREHGLTVGHWPQSMNLATVGGWVACRGAGQLSTRYGKIEDIVTGLDVVLADGRTITTGGYPRQATGPDLTQLFVGSEGTLGIATSIRLRTHPAPTEERRSAWGFDSFADTLEAMRRVLQRGATPAVLRLYDAIEADRNYQTGNEMCVLLALDEGDPVIIEATLQVVNEVAEAAGARRLDDSLVDHWMAKRNDVAALEKLISTGYVVDTMEVSGRWRDLPDVYRTTVDAIAGVEGTLSASAHQSHSYTDGGCLYFTFAGGVDAGDRDRYHREVWDAGARAALAAGASLSHHHGIGLARGRFMAEALGGAHAVLADVKLALDPNGILNPGKLGFESPFGDAPFT